jgi:hypothetical protein
LALVHSLWQQLNRSHRVENGTTRVAALICREADSPPGCQILTTMSNQKWTNRVHFGKF